MRDIKTINDAYIPSAYRSGFYMKIGVNLLLAAFFVFVLMGVIGEYAGAARTSVTLILVVVFLVGLLAFFYSKWIEQGGIRQGAELVRKMIDIDVNPRYENSQYKIRWTVSGAHALWVAAPQAHGRTQACSHAHALAIKHTHTHTHTHTTTACTSAGRPQTEAGFKPRLWQTAHSIHRAHIDSASY